MKIPPEWASRLGLAAFALAVCPSAAQLAPIPGAAVPAHTAVSREEFARLIEADWLRQDSRPPSEPASAARGPSRPRVKLPTLDDTEVGGIALDLGLDEARPVKAAAPTVPAVAPPTKYPFAAILARARALAAGLETLGLNTAPYMRPIEVCEKDAQVLQALGHSPEDAQALYYRTRWAVRRLVLANPLLDFGRLLFCKRFTQETYPDVCLNHMPWVSRPGGDVCILSASEGSLFDVAADPRTATADLVVTHVLNGALGAGHIHGMDLWFDGDRIVFGYARSGTGQPTPGFPRRLGHAARLSEEPTHIFEVGIDGRGLRQLSDGPWSDLDPTYLPDGGICFASERCATSLQCNEFDKDETSCNLYAMRADGSGIKRLSFTKDGDYLPHTLDDGTVGYTRWEYQERGWAQIQSIWFVRPDGTWADALFKQHMSAPWALEDTRSIPNSRKLVSIATGHHTLAMGPLCVIDPMVGMNTPAGIGLVTPDIRPPEGPPAGRPVPEGGVRDAGGLYTTPVALSEDFFLVCYSYGRRQTDPVGFGIYLVDVYGNKELIYRDLGISSFIPMPLRARQRPPVLSDQTDPSKNYATCLVSSVHDGVPGIDRERVKYLRISQRLAWPYTLEEGGYRYQEKARPNNWTPARVLGTVPVEPDGSACFRVPVDEPVYFQLLDENHMELRRMRSFISFQPGETRACTGCHESRATAAMVGSFSMAAAKGPAEPIPAPWGDKTVSFLRDVQPLLDRRCVRCHGGLKPAAGIDLGGGLQGDYNVAFNTIIHKRLVSWSPVQGGAEVTEPLAFGSHRSRLIEVLRGEKHIERVKLSSDEMLRLVVWIDLNAPYHDGFVNKRPKRKPYDLTRDRDVAKAIEAVHSRRCAECHETRAVSRLEWINLKEPAASLFLSAPLAKAAGGGGKCRTEVYASAEDPDYQTVLKAVGDTVARSWDAPRRDVAALVRERNARLARQQARAD